MAQGNPFRLSADGLVRPAEGTAEPKSVIFISSEGTETECDYFDHLCESLARDCPYIIHVLRHARDTTSDPLHVLALLEECRDIRNRNALPVARKIAQTVRRLSEKRVRVFFEQPETFSESERKDIEAAIVKLGIDIDYWHYLQEVGGGTPGQGDRFAVVIDRDGKSHTRETIVEIRDACREKHLDFCLSNPSFDLWLLLHLKVKLTTQVRQKLLRNAYVSADHTFASSLVSKHAHHLKSISDKTFRVHYLHKTKYALRRAALLATSDNDVIDNIGTRIPILVNELKTWLTRKERPDEK